MILRRQLTFLLILSMAFAWGYFGDPFNGTTDSDDSASNMADSEIAESGNRAPGISSEPKQLVVTERPEANNPLPVVPTGPPPRPPGAEAPARQPNPPAESLANTLDAIQPGKAQDTQIERRNAYFDRLSQQLKELNTTNNGAVAPLPGAGMPVPGAGMQAESAPENPYGGAAPIQIQPDPVAPGLDIDEEPDNLEEEEALDAEELDVEGTGEEEEVGLEP